MIPPSSTTEVSVDSVEKENEVESTEQPPSPASTTSQESKVLRERDLFFFPLFLCFVKGCIALIFIWSPVPGSAAECYEPPLTAVPAPTLLLLNSPCHLRSLSWENTCLLSRLGLWIFACVFSSLLQ